MTRIPSLTRITSTLGAGAVAGIAAWSSWSHQVHVATMVGERAEVAYFLPLSVDGLLVVASAAMVDDKRSGRTPRWSARIAFAVGVLATVGANVASAQPTWGARLVAAWPAVALLLVVELLSRRGKATAGLRDSLAQSGEKRPHPLSTPDAPTEQVHPVAAIASAPLPAPTSPAVPRLRRESRSPLTGRPLGGAR
ncbi:MAG TPA: DUF2637 domain-containing protein [Kribbellaceae bacterium]|nr:DUF2637 domain-containing protein [Kribbellaceae bacterium]